MLGLVNTWMGAHYFNLEKKDKEVMHLSSHLSVDLQNYRAFFCAFADLKITTEVTEVTANV